MRMRAVLIKYAKLPWFEKIQESNKEAKNVYGSPFAIYWLYIQINTVYSIYSIYTGEREMEPGDTP